MNVFSPIRYLLIPLCLILCTESQAQFRDLEFHWLPEAHGNKKWRPEIGFDSNRSFFNDRSVKFLGLRLGAEHRGVHRFGLAFYGMTRPESYFNVDIGAPDAALDKEVQYTAGFVMLFYERVILEAGNWEAAVPVGIGGGNVQGSYKDNQGSYLPFLESGFSAFSTGGAIKYRLLPWLEPELGFGYRLVFDSEAEVRKTLQKPYYVLKVSIRLVPLYHAVKEHIEEL